MIAKGILQCQKIETYHASNINNTVHNYHKMHYVLKVEWLDASYIQVKQMGFQCTFKCINVNYCFNMGRKRVPSSRT